MSRVARLRERLPDLGADSLLVTNATNVRYLTGFQSSNAALLVAATRSILLTDGRYLEAAGAIPDVEVVETTHEAPGDLAGRLRELATGRVGFEAAHVSVSRHARLAASGVELVPVEGAVERLRAVKDAGELAAIRRIRTDPRPGVREARSRAGRRTDGGGARLVDGVHAA